MPAKFLRESFITILETPIGQKDEVVKQVWGYQQNKKANVPTGLRFSFTIDKKLVEVADTATVRIWNLNRESRKALAQRSIYIYKTTRVRTLQIRAGYKDDFGALFNGGIERVTNTRRGPDWITEIKASSALSQILHNVFDKNWQSDAGTSALTIADELFPEATGRKPIYSPGAKLLLQNTKLPSFAAYGNAYETVRKLIRSMGLVFTVDTGKTIVTEPAKPIDEDEKKAVVVSEISGLVGSPRIDDLGYEFRTLLDHRLTVGQLIKVEAQTLEESTPGLKSLATVWEMNVQGDTHEDDWYMNVKALFFPLAIQPFTNIGKEPAIHEEVIDL